MIEVRLFGVGISISKIRSFGKNLRQSSKDEIKEGGLWLKKSMKLRAPKATGNLRDSIDINLDHLDDGWVTVGPNVPYAKFQEYGYKPHWVAGRHLHTSSGNIGQPFAAYVSKYKPFMQPAANALIDRLPTIAKRMAALATKRSK